MRGKLLSAKLMEWLSRVYLMQRSREVDYLADPARDFKSPASRDSPSFASLFTAFWILLTTEPL